MGKKGGAKKQPITPTLSHSSVSLREERTGKIQNKGASRNPKSFLKLEHLQKLAVWASGEASIPSLGAFFGRQFAVAREILGVSPDPSIILCQSANRKDSKKARRRQKKSNTPMQNNVVYKCHFCSHQNLKRGTPKGHMKEICPPKPKPPAKSEPFKSMAQKSASLEKVTKSKDEIALPSPSGDPSVLNSPALH
ncbi:hypothetical protein GH714_003686 [Hevea brasiliensis]|uniref:Uncharacterized protein n=1 Tax=Hevea brasiliensis TaxID=3981 RepID=A0A6A6L8Q3_HEVBR|nr:hypothetical protein GH714_003686 [Hevea brasiliensis]